MSRFSLYPAFIYATELSQGTKSLTLLTWFGSASASGTNFIKRYLKCPCTCNEIRSVPNTPYLVVTDFNGPTWIYNYLKEDWWCLGDEAVFVFKVLSHSNESIHLVTEDEHNSVKFYEARPEEKKLTLIQEEEFTVSWESLSDHSEKLIEAELLTNSPGVCITSLCYQGGKYVPTYELIRKEGFQEVGVIPGGLLISFETEEGYGAFIEYLLDSRGKLTVVPRQVVMITENLRLRNDKLQRRREGTWRRVDSVPTTKLTGKVVTSLQGEEYLLVCNHTDRNSEVWASSGEAYTHLLEIRSSKRVGKVCMLQGRKEELGERRKLLDHVLLNLPKDLVNEVFKFCF